MDDLNPITRTERLLDGEDLTPTNREEMFIKRIYDKTQEVPEPVNRKEYFLKKAGDASGDVTIEELNVTENGTYTAPSGKAYSPVTVEVEPPENSYQLKSITTPTSLATFEASAMPMPSLKVSVEAQQDLHGYDKPWVGGAGKNKLPMTVEGIKARNTSGTWNGNVYTKNNGTFEIVTDNENNVIGIKVRGTFNAQTLLAIGDFTLDSSTNIIYSGVSNGSAETYSININIGGQYQDDVYNGDSSPKSIPASTNCYYIIVIRENYVANDVMFYPMIRLATESDPTFAPYSNICPISGWDEAIVTDTDDLDNPTVTQTTTISLPQTVYGGELDVVNGELKITHKFVTYDGSEAWSTTSGVFRIDVSDYKKGSIVNGISNIYPIVEEKTSAASVPDGSAAFLNSDSYSRFMVNDTNFATTEAFKTFLAQNNLQVVYELAEPIIINLTPSLIKSLNGQNNLSVDCGEVIEGEYFKALGGE